MNHLTRKDVKAIRYMFCSAGLVVQMENSNEIKEHVLTGHSSKRLNSHKLVVIKIGKFQKQIEFDNTREENEDYPASLYCKMRHEKQMYQAIFEHLYALFRRSSPTISVTLHTVADFEKLIDVPGINHTVLFGETVDASMLNKHFARYPNQTSAFIDTEITGQFSEDSAIFEVPTICCEKSSPTSLFKFFNGRDLQLFNCKFDTNDVVEFLDKWISGVAYCSLELLYLFSPVSLKIDKYAIILRFGLSLWPENTPYIFEFKSSADRLNGKDNKLVYDCRPYYHVKRASDHKIAALEVETNSLKFFVFQ
ncbi:unnamed protein product [Caenorhabditis brenneri]